MVRIRPKDSALISRLLGLPNRYFTATDLEKILLDLCHNPRLEKNGVGKGAGRISALKRDLFFGYVLENGSYVATPEKALLDAIPTFITKCKNFCRIMVASF